MAKNNKGEITVQLQIVARHVRTDLSKRLLKHGFYAGQDSVILALAHKDGLTAGELAQSLGVRPPTVTKMIARLSVQGFVMRSGSETDGRLAHIHLTETGRNAVSEITGAVEKSEKKALKGLGKKDRKTLYKLLCAIEANLHEPADEVGR